MKRTLSPQSLEDISTRLDQAHEAFESFYPGTPGIGQPVHTYYAAAHVFRSDIVRQSGEIALRYLDEFAPDFVAFAKATGLPGAERLPESAAEATALARSVKDSPETSKTENYPAWFAHTVYERVGRKLRREPIEDLRIDFEDGYGNRPDDEEDRHAAEVADEIDQILASGQKAPSLGIRIKPFSRDFYPRSIRTLDILLSELVAKSHGNFPKHFYITLAKVTIPDEVAALAEVCSRLEKSLHLPTGALLVELMVETTQSILNERGEANLLRLASAAQGRCVAMHFGTYDYTAGRNLTAAYQHMLHFACDFARELMQVALSGTGIWLSDGGTNVVPVPPNQTAETGPALTPTQIVENRDAVHRAWKLHYNHIRHSLASGYYQGWDLHPAQLPVRYAAVISFFLEDLETASGRLRHFMSRADRAAPIADDAATGQGLLGYFLRAIRCGAITMEEARPLTGLTPAELQSGSLTGILAGRRR